MKCPRCGNEDLEKMRPETEWFEDRTSPRTEGRALTGNTECLVCKHIFPTQPQF